MISERQELQLHRFLAELRSRFGGARDVESVLRATLREALGLLGADSACMAGFDPRTGRGRVQFRVPRRSQWDHEFLEQFLQREHPHVPRQMVITPIYRRQRTWRALAVGRETGEFDGTDQKTLRRIGQTVSELISALDRDRTAEVRSRIERKIMEQLRAKDLFYQILHGLRSLTRYNHSSALLIAGERGDVLQLAAEQIAWRKGKSEKIGERFPLDEKLLRALTPETVVGFNRQGDDWQTWSPGAPLELVRLLDYNGADCDGREGSMLCAPIVGREGLIGVLKVASRHAHWLGRYEAELVRRFVPPVLVAIRNSRRTETLEANVLQAEKKSAMADLARGVAHDVNNALGSVVPLVQQLRTDLADGRFDPQVMAKDLGTIEHSLEVSRRIFGGMLEFARNAARPTGRGRVPSAVRGALTLLHDGLHRRRVAVELDVPDDLPDVRGGQTELQQVLFNLLANARDAMRDGGTLTVNAVRDGDQVHVTVADTGSGISAENLERIQEPFFTTKPRGYGLGLAICRSLVWEMHGRMRIHSSEGKGTRVELVLPVARDEREART